MKCFFLILGLCLSAQLYAQENIAGSHPHKFVPQAKTFYISKFTVDSNASMGFIDPRNYIGKSTFVNIFEKPSLTKVNGIKNVNVFRPKKGKVYKQEDIFGADDSIKMAGEIYDPQSGRKISYYQVMNGINRFIRIYGFRSNDSPRLDSIILWMTIDMNPTEEMYVVTTLEEKSGGLNKKQKIAENLEDLKKIGSVELFTIYFNTDKYIFEKESEPTIQRIVKFLNENQSMNISITGSADSTGPFEYNQRLSEKRAAYIRKVLIERGIKENRLTSSGIGESTKEKSVNQDKTLQLNRKTVLIREN